MADDLSVVSAFGKIRETAILKIEKRLSRAQNALRQSFFILFQRNSDIHGALSLHARAG